MTQFVDKPYMDMEGRATLRYAVVALHVQLNVPLPPFGLLINSRFDQFQFGTSAMVANDLVGFDGYRTLVSDPWTAATSIDACSVFH